MQPTHINLNPDVQYLNDGKGKTQYVVMSVGDWKQWQTELTRFTQRETIKQELREAFTEVVENGQNLQLARDFINEL